jgi:adenylate cyclase
MDFAVLQDLRDEGATDYLVSPLIFTDEAVHVATWSTRQPGGFTAAQLAGIERIIAPFARVEEIRALCRTAAILLDTYVGNQAGERILSGQIRRGDTQVIDAVIWFSDMRGSTALAEVLPAQAFIDLLNRYFDCQVPAILEHGGEVLKFIGDGLLAIFPIAGGGEREIGAVCRRAMRVARLARGNVDGLAAPAGTADAERPRFGLALHVGRLLYGNIGSANRLDFTCIGPAVNLAARLEQLAGELGHAILASQDFANGCGDGLSPVGAFRLPGVAAEQTIYRLAEET